MGEPGNGERTSRGSAPHTAISSLPYVTPLPLVLNSWLIWEFDESVFCLSSPPLEQWFSSFPMLWLFNTLPHSWSLTSTKSFWCYLINVILLLLWILMRMSDLWPLRGSRPTGWESLTQRPLFPCCFKCISGTDLWCETEDSGSVLHLP